MLCANPGRQLSPTQPLSHSPSGDGGDHPKGKSEKTRGLHTESLIGKGKAARARKAKETKCEENYLHPRQIQYKHGSKLQVDCIHIYIYIYQDYFYIKFCNLLTVCIVRVFN